MSVSLAGRPAAVCLGMGVAMLASVSLSRHNAKLWRAFRCRRLGSSGSRPLSTARLLPCATELEQADPNKLSKQKITVVQVQPLKDAL